jgi:disulfide bond formation protein DsbB
VQADFNADGFADLAVGVPGEDVGSVSNAGGVSVLYGAAGGLTAAGNQFWTQDSPGVLEAVEEEDQFGAALAAADFNGDGFADLAVGVPTEDVGDVGDAGAVQVLYGSATGLTTAGNQLWTQDSPGVLDAAEVNDRFGSALAAANFGKSAQADLAMGVPNEGESGVAFAGGVSVLYGATDGLRATGNQFWGQDTPGILNAAEPGDAFGSALAAANFGSSAQADLAVGMPNEDVGNVANAGAVQVLYGSAGGLTAAGDQLWTQDSPGILDAAEPGDAFGVALAAANFGNTTQADLAVGAAFEDDSRVVSAGAVNVLYGSASGLTAAGNQFWGQDTFGVLDAAEPGDFFGHGLAAANFGNTTQADLAVGAPGEDQAGGVSVLYGSAGGLTAAGNQFWTQDSPGVLGRVSKVIATR